MAPRLEYDNTAFFYFAIAVTTVLAIPLTYSLLKQIIGAVFVSPANVKEARTSAEREKLETIKKKQSVSKRLFSCGFFVKCGFVVALWGIVGILLTQTGQDVQINQFDPFDILGLDSPSSFSSVEDIPSREVKKAYRKLSLKWHPDKWSSGTAEEQQIAAMKFMQVSKAHQALTDEAAMENYIKFGNPDGRQQMEVSIGLPKFLLEKGNANLVLVVYLIAIVIVVPIAVYVYYSNSKKYNEKLILNDTYSIFAYLLEANFQLKHMPEVLALAAEFRELPKRSEDIEPLMDLRKKLVQNRIMTDKPCRKVSQGQIFNRYPSCNKANILIHAHLGRMTSDEYLTPALRADLDVILSKANQLIEAMREVSVIRGAKLTMTVFDFRRCLIQALWINDSDLQQLPGLGPTEVKHAKSGKGGIHSLREFIDTKPQDRLGGKRKGTASFTDTQIDELNQVLPIIPNVEFDVDVGVLDDDKDDQIEWLPEIAEGDFITIACTFTRKNLAAQDDDDKYVPLKKREQDVLDIDNGVDVLDIQGAAYAPYWPENIEEEWCLIVTLQDQDRVAMFEMAKSDKKRFVQKMKIPSQGLKPGSYAFQIYLKSTCYRGLDQKKIVRFTVVPRSQIEEAEFHADDLAIKKEPTLFEQLGMADEEDSDFAESDDEDEEPKVEEIPEVKAKEGELRQRKKGEAEKGDEDFEIVKKEGEKEE